jgi:hypothetical protein
MSSKVGYGQRDIHSSLAAPRARVGRNWNAPPENFGAQDDLPPLRTHEHSFGPRQPSSSSPATSLRGRTILIVFTAAAAVLGLAMLPQFWVPGAPKNSPAASQTARSSAAFQSQPSASLAPATSAATPDMVQPDTAGFITLGSSDQEAAEINPTKPQNETTSVSTGSLLPPAGVPLNEIVFLQRPGVNIRSAPFLTSSQIGTAPKGTRFKVVERNGDWVRVDSRSFKGWVNARFLAPNEPQ